MVHNLLSVFLAYKMQSKPFFGLLFISTWENNLGSSPPMQGTLTFQPSFKANSRFIPTYAGNMLLEKLSVTLVTVHPHVCGEHHIKLKQHKLIDGSSPRMRGTSQ